MKRHQESPDIPVAKEAKISQIGRTAHPFSSEELLNISSFSIQTSNDLLNLQLVSRSFHEILQSSKGDFLWRQICSTILDNHKRYPFFRWATGQSRTVDMYGAIMEKLGGWKTTFQTMFVDSLTKLSKQFEQDCESLKAEEEVVRLAKDKCTLVIPMKYTLNVDVKIEIGESRLGGCPDLPKSHSEWPYSQETEGNPLKFIAQINLKDVATCHAIQGILPPEGWLFLFMDTELDDRPYSFYWNGPIEELERVELPKYIEDYGAFGMSPDYSGSYHITFENEQIQPFTMKQFDELELEDYSFVSNNLKRKIDHRVQLMGHPGENPEYHEDMYGFYESGYVFLAHFCYLENHDDIESYTISLESIEKLRKNSCDGPVFLRSVHQV